MKQSPDLPLLDVVRPIVLANNRWRCDHGWDIDLDGKVRDDRSAEDIAVAFNDATNVLTLPRYPESSPVFFVYCQLLDGAGKLIVDNTYWQSQKMTTSARGQTAGS